ncbi:hypothetical protein C7S18_10470 [Ahniella affigens]|uniref:Uncharacterized protein n=1 Tax=Ahniella affigens TaxID=2021234 RepID=A0A2P1PRY9_9GAMM|nr:hypothetical protein C7S18_10470 [Ahniella affigens]
MDVAARTSPDADLSLAKYLPPAQVLNAKDGSAVFFLSPGQAHEYLVVDVPANQSSLTVTATGLGGDVDLYVSRVVPNAAVSQIPKAPAREQQPFAAATAAASEVLVLDRSALTAGQYHITPVNRGAMSSSVTIQVRGTEAATINQPITNGYYNPSRDGHGVYLATTPTVWALAWYTFDAAGDPVWYTGESAAARPSDGTWTTSLVKTTASGATLARQVVGQAILTFDGSGGFRYSWSLNGVSGSEPLTPVGTPRCASGVWSTGGVWIPSAEAGWGSSLLNFAGETEAEIVYAFDSSGEPRWAIGQALFGINLFKETYQISGFCPSCAAVPTSRVSIGSTTRYLNGMDEAKFSSSFQWTGNLSGQWHRNQVQWVKLTPRLACP